MSTIVLSCPGCGKRYELNGSLAGKKARCKACSQEFTIPVPRQISAPVTATAPSRPKASAPARPAPPPPELDSFNPYDDVEDHSAPKSSVSYDEDDTYLPPRAGAVRGPIGNTKKQKKKRRAGASSSLDDWTGKIVPVGLGLTTVLALLAFASPTIAVPALVLMMLCGFFMTLGGGIWGIVNAFRESAVCGVLYLFLPYYSLYYTISRWSEMARPFAISFVGTLMFVVVPLGLVFAGAFPQLQQNADRMVANDMAHAPGGFNAAPHAGFQPRPPMNVNGNINNFIPPPHVDIPNPNMPVMPNPIPQGFPQPPNFGPNGPGGMNNFPNPPGGMPSPNQMPIGPNHRFGGPGGMPGQ
jgi:hypothetical protein